MEGLEPSSLKASRKASTLPSLVLELPPQGTKRPAGFYPSLDSAIGHRIMKNPQAYTPRNDA